MSTEVKRRHSLADLEQAAFPEVTAKRQDPKASRMDTESFHLKGT